MTKAELVGNVKEIVEEVLEDKLTVKEANLIVAEVIEQISETLKKGEEVTLSGLGKLKVVETGARTGVSKLRGDEKPWSKPAGRKVKFQPSKVFKESL